MRIEDGIVPLGVAMLEADFIHEIAVAVALGLAHDMDLMNAELTRHGADATSNDFVQLMALLRLNDVEATRRHDLVERWARGFDQQRALHADAPFALRSEAGEQMALSWIENDCLMLLQGNLRGLPRLLRALHSADLLFDRPRWISPAWRALSSTTQAMAAPRDPTLAEVHELLDAVRAARNADRDNTQP
jgi:hypothetical protein